MDKQYCNPEIWGGIECTINRVKNEFHDQLQYSGHYEREGDIDAIVSVGIRKVRYPVLWEKHQPTVQTVIDWSWTESRLNKFKEKGIDVIAGLVHHGSGPAFTNLSDRNFPALLAEYARKVAEKFPWLEYYTPVNEPLTTARFSGLYGIWYPHHNNAKSFMQMLLNELKGTVLAMREIRKINPNAKLVQTEDLGKTYSTLPLRYQAKFENERRWLTYDILCGRFDSNHRLWKYFKKFTLLKEDFQFFLDNPCPPDIFGFNHYLTSERFLDHRTHLYPEVTHGGNHRHKYADVEAVRVEVEEETGLEVLLREAWDRYKKPIAITEVHLHCTREEQLRWFKEVWTTANKLKEQQIDLVAITTWAMLGSYGWNKLLTKPGGDYEPGAFNVSGGEPRPTALAKFIREVALNNCSEHHVSEEKGWWRRSSRLIYKPSLGAVQMISDHTAPILIIGKSGTLGKAFARLCEERCLNYRLLGREDCDITSPRAIDQVIAHYKPWAIINAAGFVRVDDAEKESDACFQSNTKGSENLAIACNKAGIRLVTFSSDLVFDGMKNKPYTESDPVGPLNVYGESKARSEQAVLKASGDALVIRTSAFFGPWDEYNFVHYVRKALSQYESISVPGDIYISPTYVPHLVNATLDLLIDEESGIWHLANRGELTWSDLAIEVANRFKLDKSLIRTVNHAEMQYIAARPLYTVLTSEKGSLLPSLESALHDYFELGKIEKRKVA
jgi:dTDP-4-dehydrorhamnose reductase